MSDGKPGFAGPEYCPCGVMWPTSSHKATCGEAAESGAENAMTYEEMRAELKTLGAIRAERDSLRCQVVNGAKVEKRLKAELAQTNDALEQANHSLKAAQAGRDQLGRELSEARQKLAEAEADVRCMGDRLRTSAALLKDAERSEDNLTKELDELRSEMEAMRCEHAEACGEVARLAKRSEHSEIEAERLRTLFIGADASVSTLKDVLRLMIAGGGR